MKKTLLITFIIVIFDQIVKFWVKTHMTLGEQIKIFGDWFIIYFTENPGMAFGYELDVSYGKLLLSLFRIIAIIALIYFIYNQSKKGLRNIHIVALSMILAGAIGNMIDSAFYGLIFSESTFFNTAEFMPKGGGYTSFLHGKVVDMLYFPIIKDYYPEWVPFVGGDEFLFFRPIFNIADSFITIGIMIIIIFQKGLLKQ